MNEELKKVIKELEAFLRDAEMWRKSNKKPVVLLKDEEAVRIALKHLKELK